MNRKSRVQAKPRYLKTKPYCLVKIPWVTTDGEPSCPQEYNNSVHAAVHSILAGMKCNKIEDVRFWLRTGRRQLSRAIRMLSKPGAAVVPSGPGELLDAPAGAERTQARAAKSRGGGAR